MSDIYIDLRALIEIPVRSHFNWNYCIKHTNIECAAFLSQTGDYYNTALENIRTNNNREAIIAFYNYYSNINGIIQANNDNRISQNENRIFMTEWTSGIEPQNKYKITNISYEKSIIISCIGLLLIRLAAEEYNNGTIEKSRKLFLESASCFDYLNSLNSKLEKGLFPKECSVEFAIAMSKYSAGMYSILSAINYQSNRDIEQNNVLELTFKLSNTASILLLRTKEYLNQEIELGEKNKAIIFSILMQIESIKIYNFILKSQEFENNNQYTKTIKILEKCEIISSDYIKRASSLFDVDLEEDGRFIKLVTQGEQIKERLRKAKLKLEYFPDAFIGEIELTFDTSKFVELPKIEPWLPYRPRFYQFDSISQKQK